MTIKDALLAVPPQPARKHSDAYEEDLNQGRVQSYDALSHVNSTGLLSCTFNVLLAVLGAGQLSLPYALKQLGLIWGVLGLVFFTLLSMHSLHTLSLYELHFAPSSSSCLDSYADLVVRVLGSKGSWICRALLVLYAWGGAVAFLVILKSELNYLLSLELGGYLNFDFQLAVLPIALVILWPLSSQKDLSAMKRFSGLGCAGAIFVTIVTLHCFPWESFWTKLKEAASTDTTDIGRVAATLPLLSFSLNSTWAYIPILCTLSDKSGRTFGLTRVDWLVILSNILILANYLALSVCGYLGFGFDLEPNILDSLPNNNWVFVAKIFMCLQLTLALPMRFFVARKTLEDQLPEEWRRWDVRWGLAFLLVVLAVTVALPPVSLATVLGITSSICASMIIYILPATIDLKLQLPGRTRKVISAISGIVGFFGVLLAGLWANVTGRAVGS